MTDLFDPAVDLYVVEGKKKALALASRGLCAITVWGVWAWGKKPSEHARCELLSDWDAIPLDGRRVFVPFDSDRDEKDNVDLAARHLAGRLAERGAEVYHVILPNEPDGSKNGADDLIVRHGFEAFERCVEEALDRGPHGMEALRAAWRRQRAVIRDLKERAAATAALLELPTEKCDPGEKTLLLTAAAELSKRQADKGATDYRSFCIDTMARRAGMSAGTYGRKLKRFYTGDNRLFDYDRKPLNPDDPLDPRRSIYLRPARESCGTFTGILWTAITTAEARDDTWGGTREPKPIPLCPTHGDACDALKMSQLVCGGADEDGNLCGEFLGEPTQRLVSRNTDLRAGEDIVDVDEDRNTQDACSRLDHTSSPLPVAIPTQDADSTTAPPALTLEMEAAPSSQPVPTGRCPGCNDVWTPRKGSDATMCGACRYYAAQQASAVVTA